MTPNKPERSDVQVWTFDDIAEGLQQLRARAGNPSYAEIVRRIATARRSEGCSAEAAHPPRTTVYDCFRTGRARMNAQLVGEIVVALTSDRELAMEWQRRCSAAQPGVRPEETRAPVPEPPPPGFALILMTASLALNLALIWVFAGPPLGWLKLPVFMDMIGTAICAIALGPWYGAAVGVLTNLGETAVLGPSSIPFAIVQVVGALLWGYGARRWGLGRSLPRYFLLHLAVALACTITATPILVLLFPADGGNNSQITLINSIHLAVDSYIASVFSGNLYYSVVDKLIAGFAALPALGHIHRRYPIPGLAPLLPNREPSQDRPNPPRGPQISGTSSATDSSTSSGR